MQVVCNGVGIKELTDKNDRLVLVLHNELQSYQDAVIKEQENLPAPSVNPELGSSKAQAALSLKNTLGEFAQNNRQIYKRTQFLAGLSLRGSENAYLSQNSLRENIELSLPILQKPNSTNQEDVVEAGMSKLAIYQDIRLIAQNAVRSSDLVWGAVTSYLLPVLYAVLGALAFILRDLTERTSKNTLRSAYARSANRGRLLAAVMAGTAIGLFGGIWEAPLSLAPPLLVVAFLAGYAADKFFSFLDKAVASRGKDAALRPHDVTPAIIEEIDASSNASDQDVVQTYISMKRRVEHQQTQSDIAYSRLSTKEVLQVRGIDRFAVSVFGILAIITWAAQLVPGLAITLIASAHAKGHGTTASVNATGDADTPLGLPSIIWNGMEIVIFVVFITISLAFLWKGYFAKSKSEKAANFIDRFATLALGVFLGKNTS